MTFEATLKQMEKGEWKPIYFLQGDEGYFMDRLIEYAEEHALPEEAKGFNQTIIYGRDARTESLLDAIRRFPMMAEKQLVILKEAQEYKDLKDLESYLNKPVPSTIFIVANRGGKAIRKGTKLAKVIEANGILLNCERIKEHHMADWITAHLEELDVRIKPKAAQMLVEYLGNDLAKVMNAIDKLNLQDRDTKEITPGDIEKYVGISKDYNAFELSNALLDRDAPKAYRIVKYFAANPKAGPMPVVMYSMYALFSKLFLLNRYPGATRSQQMSMLRVPPFVFDNYITAQRYYNMERTREALSILSDYDLRSKGVGNALADDGALYQELVYKLMNL